MRPWEEWADRVYTRHGRVAHVVAWGDTLARCGRTALWLGTGSWQEQEKAQALVLCADCLAVLDRTRSPMVAGTLS